MKTNCPNCGAPVNTDYVRCQYCGTPYEVERAYETFTLYADNLPVYSVDVLKQQMENALYARRTEELYKEAISAMRRYSGNSDEEIIQRDVEEKLTMVKENLDDIERNYFWGNLIFVFVMMLPVIITVLSILFK